MTRPTSNAAFYLFALGLLVFLLLPGIACSDDDVESDETPAEESTEDEEEASADQSDEEEDGEAVERAEGYAALPGGGGDETCGSLPEDPDICDWLAVPELIVMGEIESIEISDTLFLRGSAVEEGDDPYIDRECERFINPGLELKITITEVLGGDFAKEVLEFHIPRAHVSTWLRSPREGEDGELEWPFAEEDYLPVGAEVGATLIKNEEAGIWTTYVSPLFSGLEESGEIMTSVESRPCQPEVLTFGEARETPFDEFKDMITECVETKGDDPDVLETRNMQKDFAETYAGLSHGSRCTESQPAFPKYCLEDNDCESEEEDGGLSCGDDGRCE